MSERKKKILGHILNYASSQYFSQFMGFFTAVFMRMFLGPFNIGVWSILRVVADYSAYTHLGTTSTVFYKLPYHRAKGEMQEADNVKDVVFTYLALTTFVMGIGIAIYAFLFRSTLMPQIFWGLLVVSVLIFCRRIYTYYVTLLRVNKNFTVLSKSIIFDAVVNFGLVLVLVRNFQLKGLFASVILMPIMNVLFIKYFVDFDIKYRLSLNKLGSYIKFGFPLFIVSILSLILYSVDRIMIAKFLGLEALGFYSIGIMARMYGEGLSRNFNVVITPHFLEDYGKAGDIETATKYLKVPAELMSTFMVLILGMIYIAAPPLVVYILPKFTPGIMSMKLLLLAAFFYVASPQSQHFLIVVNKQTKLVPIIGVVIFVNIILNFVFIKLGYGITGVALATVISAFVSFSIVLTYAMMHIENILGTLKFAVLLLSPLVYSVFVLLALDRMILISNPLLSVLVKVLLFVILFIPWIYRVNKRTSVLSIIREMLYNKFKKKKGVQSHD